MQSGCIKRAGLVFAGVLFACSLAATARDGGVAEEGASKPSRSAAAVREFRRLNPCPATGQTRGACPGWVVDHAWPICANGPDVSKNLRWSAQAEARAKDREERAMCVAIKSGQVDAPSTSAEACRLAMSGRWLLLADALCVDSAHGD